LRCATRAWVNAISAPEGSSGALTIPIRYKRFTETRPSIRIVRQIFSCPFEGGFGFAHAAERPECHAALKMERCEPGLLGK
jgi:hypothetical protein